MATGAPISAAEAARPDRRRVQRAVQQRGQVVGEHDEALGQHDRGVPTSRTATRAGCCLIDRLCQVNGCTAITPPRDAVTLRCASSGERRSAAMWSALTHSSSSRIAIWSDSAGSAASRPRSAPGDSPSVGSVSRPRPSIWKWAQISGSTGPSASGERSASSQAQSPGGISEPRGTPRTGVATRSAAAPRAAARPARPGAPPPAAPSPAGRSRVATACSRDGAGADDVPGDAGHDDADRHEHGGDRRCG